MSRECSYCNRHIQSAGIKCEMLHSSKLLLLKFHFLKARLWSRTCDILLEGLKEMFLLTFDDNDIFLYSFTVFYCKNLLCMSMHSFTTIAVNKHIWTTVFALGSMNKHFSPNSISFFWFSVVFFALENDMMTLQMPQMPLSENGVNALPQVKKGPNTLHLFM